MPYKLYWRVGSGSLIAEAALVMAGADYVGVEVPQGREPLLAPSYLSINPMAQIPAVVAPNGTVLVETAAIQLTLDEWYPNARLLPPSGTAERATALRWLMFLATAVYPACIRAYYAERYTIDRSVDAIAAVQTAATDELDRLFTLLASAIKGPCLLGETLCIVDVYAAMLADWHPPALEMEPFLTLRSAILAHPGISAVWDRHGFAR
jgi:glutathione S-transferase